jgi:hypothetical protein
LNSWPASHLTRMCRSTGRAGRRWFGGELGRVAVLPADEAGLAYSTRVAEVDEGLRTRIGYWTRGRTIGAFCRASPRTAARGTRRTSDSAGDEPRLNSSSHDA